MFEVGFVKRERERVKSERGCYRRRETEEVKHLGKCHLCPQMPPTSIQISPLTN